MYSREANTLVPSYMLKRHKTLIRKYMLIYAHCSIFIIAFSLESTKEFSDNVDKDDVVYIHTGTQW